MPRPPVPDYPGPDPVITELVVLFQQAAGEDDLLDRAAAKLAQAAGASRCSILLSDHSVDTLYPAGTFPETRDSSTSRLSPDESQGLVESARSGVVVDDAFGDDTLAMPLEHNGRAMGVVQVEFPGDAPPGALTRLAAMVRVVTPLLRGEMMRSYQARKSALAGQLINIAARLSQSRDTSECLADLARSAAGITGSAGAVIRVAGGDEPAVRSFYSSRSPGVRVIGTPNDLEAAVSVLDTGRSVMAQEGFNDLGPVRENLLAVPMTDGSGMPGVLTVFDRTNSSGDIVRYTRLERETLTALVSLGRNHLVHHHQESQVSRISGTLEHRIRELAFLHQVSRTALRTGDTRDILRSLLTAVTHGEGLGFDRAFLFLHDMENGLLEGTIGVAVAGRSGHRDGDADDILEAHSDQDHQVEGVAVELEPERGVLPRTVLEKRPFHVKLPRDQNMVCPDVIKVMGSISSFVTVPLLSEDRVLGVIWVDNLHSGRAIGPDDINLLVSAATQAGLIVERSFQHEAIEMLSGEMLDLQQRLTQWEKMAALGEMAASVAHDIRNPLVSIGGFARRLRKLLPDGTEGDKYTEVIIREVDRLERTLGDVLSFSRGYGSLELATVALDKLLKDCAELFRENFKKKGVTIRRTIEPDLPGVEIDERQVRQAILNILFNAGEAVSEEDGEVSLEASLARDQGRDVLLITIKDNGPGIPPEELSQIFTPFYTTKGAGTGLGLAIAQRAVSGHGGEIRVDNRYGKGVTFSIQLPLETPRSGKQHRHLEN
jgi:signal transduction histidine kinase